MFKRINDKKLIFACSLVLFPVTADAWDGYDWENNAYIEIEKENLVRSGRDIEIFDYGDGGYKDVEVIDINQHGNVVDVEVYDHETGQYRTFEMEGR